MVRRRTLALGGAGAAAAAVGAVALGPKALAQLQSGGSGAAGGAAPAPSPWAIGGNLSIWDWMPSPYVDLIKSARGFGKPGTFDEDRTLKRDAQGWPLEASQIVVLATNDRPSMSIAAGTWRGRYKGRATMTASITDGCRVENVRRSGEVVTFDCIVTGPTALGFAFDGPISDLRLVAPGFDLDNHPLLIPQALDHYKRFHTLRMLDFMGLNDTEDRAEATWSQRQAPGKFHGRRSWEAMAEFFMACYKAPGSRVKGLWINTPFKFGEADSLELGRFMAGKLPPEVLKYCEFSNELWNSAYGAKWAYFKTRADNPQDPDYASINTPRAGTEWERLGRLWALTAARNARAMLQAFGPGALGKTVFPVLAGQTVNVTWQKEYGLPWLARAEQVKALGGPPSIYFGALAMGPYISGEDAEMNTTPNPEQMLAKLRDGYAHSVAALRNHVAQWRAMQKAYGIAQLVAYEWQLHTHGDTNLDVKFAANTHPEVEKLIVDQAVALREAGVGLMCFHAISPQIPLKRDMNSWLWPATPGWDLQASPKGRALATLLARTG
jgi:hypothetical protein